MDAKTQYNLGYAKQKLKRVPLDLQKDYFDSVLVPAAATAGQPVNTFIKQAIAEHIERINKKSQG